MLDIDIICPGHGPVLRSDWKKWVDLSAKLATDYLNRDEDKRVFIPYVSAYHKTGLIAEKISEGLKSAGDIEVNMIDIEHSSLGDLDQGMSMCKGVIVGSPTINQNILLPVYKLLSVISPLRDKGKLAGGFGSFGWSGEGKKLIQAGLENLKLDYFKDGVFVKFTPDEEEQKIAFEYGKAFGEELLRRKDK